MNEQPKVLRVSIPFIDLAAQRRRIGAAVDRAVARVLEHGQYIMGPEVKLLETDLAQFCGARHAVSCSNGTDALSLVLRAKGLKPGEAVLCPSFTFAHIVDIFLVRQSEQQDAGSSQSPTRHSIKC